MEGTNGRIDHLASVFVLRQEDEVDVERGEPFCASNDIVVVSLDVDLCRQQLAVNVLIPIPFASQHNSAIGGAVVGKRQGIGGVDLDGLSRIGGGVVGNEIKA